MHAKCIILRRLGFVTLRPPRLLHSMFTITWQCRFSGKLFFWVKDRPDGHSAGAGNLQSTG